MSDEFVKSMEPVVGVHTGQSPREPEDGAALCLSGGGYRAMLFHVGALWRLYEAGRLQDIKRISSVSGGSGAPARAATAARSRIPTRLFSLVARASEQR